MAIRALERRISFGVLNGMTGFMGGDAHSCNRGRVIDAARQMQLLVPWIIMIAKKIVRLNNLDIVNLGRLQDFAGTLRAGDV